MNSRCLSQSWVASLTFSCEDRDTSSDSKSSKATSYRATSTQATLDNEPDPDMVSWKELRKWHQYRVTDKGTEAPVGEATCSKFSTQGAAGLQQGLGTKELQGYV